MVLASKDTNVVDPFTTGSGVPRASLHKPTDAKVITYSRRRNKNAAAKRTETNGADGLATAQDELAVVTPTKAPTPTSPSPETPHDQTDDRDYEGPFEDSDSDCGGPGSVMKKAQMQRLEKNRGARLARAAQNAKHDAAAVSAKLEQQKEFFAQVDGFSLASESEGNTPIVVAQKKSSMYTTVGTVIPVAIESKETEKPHAPVPTTPGTKFALTSEWLNAIPESFTPGAGDGDDDQSVEIEEEFVVTDDEEENVDGETAPSAPLEVVAEETSGDVVEETTEESVPESVDDDDVALGSPSVVDALGAALGGVTITETNDTNDKTTGSLDIQTYASENANFAQFLTECGQTPKEVLPMSNALERHIGNSGVVKIGEGTYGEAFKSVESNLVLKIVPMAGTTLINGEPQMGCTQIAAEANVARKLTSLRPSASNGDGESDASTPSKNVTSGFIDTKNVFVCRGPYAPALLQEWRQYDQQKTSENENPELFPDDQLYAVFAAADGGVDLECAEIKSHAEAKSILLQVTIALAVAEEACKFEHRDLHWGNVLLNNCGVDDHRTSVLNGVELTYPTCGVDVNVIDFTLSRLELGGGNVEVSCSSDGSASTKNTQNLAFCDLNTDPELFNGPEGHCQSETYRLMKKATNSDWSMHAPKTNALWLRYLADCLAVDKNYAKTSMELAELKAFKKRAQGYASAQEALWDGLFVGVFKTNYGF